jgi:hypothetical protein
MSSKSVIKYFAKPARILMVILILLLGLFVIQMVALGIEMMLTIQKTNKWTYEPFREHKEPTMQEKIDRSEKIFLPDGTIFLKFTEYSSTKRQSIIKIYDVNNNLIWDGFSAYDANTNKEVFKDTNDAPMPFEDYLRWNEISENISYPFIDLRLNIKASFSDTLDFVTDSAQDGWRYDFTKGYFTGYSSNREIIGYIGLNGFVKNKEDVKSFGRLLCWKYQRQYDYEIYSKLPVILITDKCACLLDIPNRKVDILFNAEGNNITGFSSYESYMTKTSSIKYRPWMDFLTADNVHHLILQEPEQKLNVSLPENGIGNIEDLALTATENDIFFKITLTDESLTPAQKRRPWQNKEYRSKEHKKSIGLYKVNQAGSLELISRYDWTSPLAQYVESDEDKNLLLKKTKPFITALSPPLYGLVWRAYGDYITDFSYADSVPVSAVFGIINESRPLNAPFNLLISLAVMAFTFWHGLARRTSWVKLIFWVILAGLFNLAGLLMYLALNHTSVIKCHICGKKRGLQSDLCVRCGNPLSSPQRKPTDLILAN